MRRRISALCHRRPKSNTTDVRPEPKENQRSMADKGSCSQGAWANQVKETKHMANSESTSTKNIIVNHDFSEGLRFWHPNSCEAHVVSGVHGNCDELAADLRQQYVVVTKRTERWQGLEQDITGRIYPGSKYAVSSHVKVGGDIQGGEVVQGTLKLVFENSPTKYLFLGRVPATGHQWEQLDGYFSLEILPKQVVFYLEGPSPGVDLMVSHVTILSCTSNQHKEATREDLCDDNENIVVNPQFEDGLNNWSGRGCKILLHDSMDNGKILPETGKAFASATERSQNWNGIQQEITNRVQRKLAYEVTAVVRIFGSSSAEVRATIWVQSPNGREQYIGIAKLQASDREWAQLQGKFLLSTSPSKAVIYVEGPPPGIDILVNSLVVKHAKKLPPPPPPDMEKTRGSLMAPGGSVPINIIWNHDFSEDLHSWNPNGCNGHVVSGMSNLIMGVTAKTGRSYAVISNRTKHWQGLEQDITAKVSPGLLYSVSACVRVHGTLGTSAEVQATLKLEYKGSSVQYLSAGRAEATTTQWMTLEGSFRLIDMPNRAIFFLEGPPSGVNLLVDSVIISPCIRKWHGSYSCRVDVINNSNLDEGLNGWHPLGSCNLKVCTGSPHLLPPLAKDSLGQHKLLNGRYILATNRSETWMGPAQTITDRLELHVTYQVSAWVRVGSGPGGPQTVNVALGVDDNWVNGGQVSVDGARWYELAGSFRIERKPSKVIAYIQGPSSGVDVMVAGLHIFPVDRKARFQHLKKQTEKVRKREVVLNISGPYSSGCIVNVRQVKNSFPFGSCINRSNIENEDFVDFFLKNFNWAVFENELKWYHTEPRQGTFNYADADVMLEFCKRHGIETRGHCIFWEVPDAIQPWVQSLSITDLMTAIQIRLNNLLSRYKGQFRHYDVNNEMLHGSFYQDRLGRDIRAYMFKAAHELDPSALLFVNDYHVEDRCDSKSSPEMYIQHILDLQERGAPIGGIGIQGHIHHPVGPLICSALDKLAILGLPIWFTEVDVSAENEHVRADDLEVVLREAYAHPAVEGIVLWGFWETFMCGDHCHLVDAEGEINEAGRRYLALKQEWMSNADGTVDENGEFKFRGFHGTYTVEITTPSKKFLETIVVEGGNYPLLVNIKLA